MPRLSPQRLLDRIDAMARNGSEMTMTDVLVRADGLDVNEVPDGYVIYQTDADRVHYLNKTAAIVFELCDGARGTDDIVRA